MRLSGRSYDARASETIARPIRPTSGNRDFRLVDDIATLLAHFAA
jgi:hypothetical protein